MQIHKMEMLLHNPLVVVILLLLQTNFSGFICIVVQLKLSPRSDSGVCRAISVHQQVIPRAERTGLLLFISMQSDDAGEKRCT